MSTTSTTSRGQALVETAITLPAIFLLLFGFLAVLIRVEAQVELDTATSLALASCVSAREGSSECGKWAHQTYTDTMSQYSYIEIKPGVPPCPDVYHWHEHVTCRADATLLYRNTPMAYLVLGNVTIQSTATTIAPDYRSQ